MLANFSVPTNSLVNDPVIGPLIIDATYVPSRFAGTAFAAGSLDPMLNPLNNHGLTKLHHLSRWREPGKVNINTVVSGVASGIDTDDIVWTTLIGGTTANPFAGIPRTRTRPAIPGGPGIPTIPANPGDKGEPAKPAKTIAELVSFDPENPTIIKNEVFPPTSPRGRNPYFSYFLASRLSNTATIRSQVFAVWVSVRITDDSPNAPPPITKRMFAIIDRSIPVGYSPGENLNVSDCIRLKRYLD
jgi:hypothetical protein